MEPATITAIAAIVTSTFSLGLQLVQQYKLIKLHSSCCEVELKSELSSSSSSSSTTKDEPFNENDIKVEESQDSADEEEEEEDNRNFGTDSN